MNVGTVTMKYTQRLKSIDYKLDPSRITVKIYDKESDTVCQEPNGE